MKTCNSRLHILLALFSGVLIGMNILGTKIIPVPFGLSVSVGIFLVPLSFLITDIVEEVYGREMVTEFLKSGLITLVCLFAFTAFFVWLPSHERFTNSAEYSLIFGSSLRIMIASLAAFALGQLHDIWAFAFWKKKTGGRFLWLRNNASTIVSQAIDTFVFMMIAFLWVNEHMTFDFVFFKMTLPYYGFRVLFAFLDTPLIYLGVWWLRKDDE